MVLAKMAAELWPWKHWSTTCVRFENMSLCNRLPTHSITCPFRRASTGMIMNDCTPRTNASVCVCPLNKHFIPFLSVTGVTNDALKPNSKSRPFNRDGNSFSTHHFTNESTPRAFRRRRPLASRSQTWISPRGRLRVEPATETPRKDTITASRYCITNTEDITVLSVKLNSKRK